MEAEKKSKHFLYNLVVYPSRALILILMFQEGLVRFKPFGSGRQRCNATPLLALVLIMESFFAKSAACLTNA